MGNEKVEKLDDATEDIARIHDEISVITLNSEDPRMRGAGANINTQLSSIQSEIMHLREYIKTREETYLAHCADCDAEYRIGFEAKYCPFCGSREWGFTKEPLGEVNT